jgi:hypothetical protein
VIKSWGKKSASILVDGEDFESKQGHVRDVNGKYQLVVWLDINSTNSVKINIDNR